MTTATANANELDTTKFNDTPIIRKLSKNKADEQPKSPIESPNAPKSNRGRKRKYNSPEERLAARRLQQRAYRERKKQQAQDMKTE